jgi:hypothetical protein
MINENESREAYVCQNILKWYIVINIINEKLKIITLVIKLV